jgi:hypothetical protein
MLEHNSEPGSDAIGTGPALRKRGDPLASVAPAGGRSWGRAARSVPAEYQLSFPASVAPAGAE